MDDTDHSRKECKWNWNELFEQSASQTLFHKVMNLSLRGKCRGVTRGARGHDSPGAESLPGAPKSPSNVASTFFSRVYLGPKDLRFGHGGAKLASCPERHLNSLRPSMRGKLPSPWHYPFVEGRVKFLCKSKRRRRTKLKTVWIDAHTPILQR